MKFHYQVRTKTGKIQSGVVEASNREAALDVLKGHGLYVTVLEEFAVPFYARGILIFDRVTRKDIVLFSRQLAIMFKSRVPLVETFQVLAQQTRSRGFRTKIFKISEAIEGGMSLSKSLGIFPKLFSVFYISMVKSGEASGKLTDIFNYLADYLEQEHYFHSRIRGAMIYPAFVLLVFVIVLTILITFVIPQLALVLKESEQELPLITRVVIGLSGFLRTKGWILVVAVVAAVVAVFRVAKTPAGKRFFDQNLLRVPLLGTFLKKLYLARFALNLTTLVSGGLPIANALEITGEVVGNDVYKDILKQTQKEVRKGEPISSVLQRYPKYITPLFLQMVVVGEKTGTLDTSLGNVVEFYQKDIDRQLDVFIKLIEPIFIIVLGLVVGGLMAAVMIPLYSFGI